jgi:hypothetical protein
VAYLWQSSRKLCWQALSGHRGSDGKFTVEEFHSMSKALAEGSETLPNLPTDSFSRESFYQDRQ